MTNLTTSFSLHEFSSWLYYYRLVSFYIFTLQKDFIILVDLIWSLYNQPTTYSRAKLFEGMFEMCDMIDAWKCLRSGKLCDLKISQIKKSEADLKKAMAVHSHFTNPWKLPNKDRLYCLSSSFSVENRNRNRHFSSR